MGLVRETQRRVESLIAWLLAISIILLVFAGAYWVVTVV